MVIRKKLSLILWNHIPCQSYFLLPPLLLLLNTILHGFPCFLPRPTTTVIFLTTIFTFHILIIFFLLQKLPPPMLLTSLLTHLHGASLKNPQIENQSKQKLMRQKKHQNKTKRTHTESALCRQPLLDLGPVSLQISSILKALVGGGASDLGSPLRKRSFRALPQGSPQNRPTLQTVASPGNYTLIN